MAYELRLPPDTQNEIRDYVLKRFDTPELQRAAIDAIERELGKLAVNPGLGTARPGGPFEHRPIYRFGFELEGVTRYVQVTYKVHKKDAIIVIAGFAPLQL
jgi:plasmid stabilization system protein ParE